jgi:glutamine amidotransferase
MIVIVDYGLGNLRSVAGSLKKLGLEFLLSSNPEDIRRAKKLILPGVGAFPDGMKNLKRLGLIDPLYEVVIKEKKPILGICLGAQLMAKESFEFGHHQGLGWIDASVVKMEVGHNDLRLPHVGWNDLFQIKIDPLLEGICANALFYYVHSFHLQCHNRDIVIGECEYGIRFAACLHQDNIYATQFHPEKSQLHGLTLLKNFLDKA